MEEYSVKITRQAEAQMADIFRYIAFTLRERGTALRILDSLEAEIASLSSFPRRAALTDEEPWHSLGVHKLSVKNYLIYFWIDEKARKVQVTAVIHSRMNQREQLSKMELQESE